MSSQYSTELEVAVAAVKRAATFTEKVAMMQSKGTLVKSDQSPVTLGDFGAQALIIKSIKLAFPSDQIVGEEDSTDLAADRSLASTLLDLLTGVQTEARTGAASSVSVIKDESDLLDTIGSGNGTGGRSGRFWALDPIDGTSGFLRGGQYAIALALIVDGDVKVGVLGCPNLSRYSTAVAENSTHDSHSEHGGSHGILIAAQKDCGATMESIQISGHPEQLAIDVKPLEDVAEAVLCESFEPGHASHSEQSDVAAKIGIVKPHLRLDSQAKYAMVAMGRADVYLRFPTNGHHREKIWDHAAGDLIVREAGGVVSDVEGRPLDHGTGRTLAGNKGVVVAPKVIHGALIEVIRDHLSL